MIGFLDRLLRDHTISAAVMVVVCFVTIGVIHADQEMRASAELVRGVAAATAELAAEEAGHMALRAAEPEWRGRRPFHTSWGRVDVAFGAGAAAGTLELTVAGRGRELRFGAEILAGAAPRCFAHRLTVGQAEREDLLAGGWIEPGEARAEALRPTDGAWPQAMVTPDRIATLPGLRSIAGLSFRYLRGGTDRADFAWTDDAESGHPRRLQVSRTGLLRVPGNLWVEPDDAPLAIELDGPLTVVVEGNLYLGRSLHVFGEGCLTVWTRRSGMVFRDLDGDGVRGAGEPALTAVGPPREGSGSAYLGLVAGAGSVELAGNLVAEGEVHALAAHASVEGSVVAAFGVTRCSAVSRLLLTGRRLGHVERTRVPGFATSGQPRPSILRRLPERWLPPRRW